MSCKVQYYKLFACGLNVFIIFCALSECKVIGSDVQNSRFLNFFSGMQSLTDRYCKDFCGQSRFLFSLALQKRHCQLKCPNSALANLPLPSDRNSSTTTPTSNQFTSPFLPTTSTERGNMAGLQNSTATNTDVDSNAPPAPEVNPDENAEAAAGDNSRSTVKRATPAQEPKTKVPNKKGTTASSKVTPPAPIPPNKDKPVTGNVTSGTDKA